MSDPVMTRTLADLYLAQGHVTEARDAYALLLCRFPDDEKVASGLKAAQSLVTESKKTRLLLLMDEWGTLDRKREGGVAP
ncbi:tetratricopeptide repeat protein [Desulfoluna spongiiphila]|uniref:tetratricopeptide repeat protein n=1 Tax=Desulfoluna spongiiphila TaxID=419481 RepID=UPI00125FB745|nr:tetratricopeptide repeat protein [Desulfoluna spongiiphila]